MYLYRSNTPLVFSNVYLELVVNILDINNITKWQWIYKIH